MKGNLKKNLHLCVDYSYYYEQKDDIMGGDGE
jgi:hypothetical protein